MLHVITSRDILELISLAYSEIRDRVTPIRLSQDDLVVIELTDQALSANCCIQTLLFTRLLKNPLQ